MIELNGDTANIPASAVMFDGRPWTGRDIRVVRRDDKWWISVGH